MKRDKNNDYYTRSVTAASPYNEQPLPPGRIKILYIMQADDLFGRSVVVNTLAPNYNRKQASQALLYSVQGKTCVPYVNDKERKKERRKKKERKKERHQWRMGKK